MSVQPFLEDFGPRFLYYQIRQIQDVPAADSHIVDVALLDMHHGWPNLGRDSLVRALGEICLDLQPLLETAGMKMRVLSYDVRRSGVVPETPGRRFALYVGTGGPGHIDPHRNDGVSDGTQGIREDPAWEAPAFRLFDAIAAHDEAALLGVCHSFGVLCRWSGAAHPVLRSAGKGGKSSGLVESILTEDALCHPWFSRFSAKLPDQRRFSSLDSRLYDLIPSLHGLPHGRVPVSYEVNASTGMAGDALTMIEFARDRGGAMPRILALNHHPEIRDRNRQRRVLESMFARGEVARDWYEERSRTLDQAFSTPESERDVALTSHFTLLAPLRFHLYRQVRQRADKLGVDTALHEDSVLRDPSGLMDRNHNC